MTYTLVYENAYGRSIEFSMQSGIVIAETDGLTSNRIELLQSQGVDQIGAVLLGQSVQPRVISIRGTILGESLVGRRQLLETIMPEIPAKLIFNDRWQIDVRPSLTPDISRTKRNTEFAFTLQAPFPYWYSTAETMTMLAGKLAMFKFPWNLTETANPIPNGTAAPWSFSKHVLSYFTEINNVGNAPTPFNVMFIASTTAKNPRITNAETLQFIAVDKEMQAGETIVVSMTESALTAVSIYGGETTDIFNALNFDNSYFKLVPGNNIIRFDADENRDGVDCRIVHRTTRVGAYE